MNWLEAQQRIESKRIILDNGCWELKNSHKKYPTIYVEGNTIELSHAIFKIYKKTELINQALHRCDNPKCWNPEHIYDGTQSDNILESVAKGRTIAPKVGSPSTQCPQGHEHNSENTYYYTRSNGKINKVCKICSKEHLKNRRIFQRNLRGKF